MMRIKLTFLMLLAVAALWFPVSLAAAPKDFVLGGLSFTLQDVSADVDVYFRSMRFLRPQNAWNVDVTLSNKSGVSYAGPFVLLVDGFTGTSGPQSADGQDGSQPAKSFYDFSGTVPDGEFSPAESSASRTLTLGFQSGGSPRLTVKVFARVAAAVNGLNLVRTLNEAGQPLPSVTVEGGGPPLLGKSAGPAGFGLGSTLTDDAFGLATLTQTNASAVIKFTTEGYLPVWRVVGVTSNGVGVIPSPRLTRRDPNFATLTPIGGGNVARAHPSVSVQFTPGSFSSNATARLTLLTPQTLPLFLPLGWSPLHAFWLELSAEPALPATASLTPLAGIATNETAALVRLNPGTLAWEVLQLVNGNGSNAVNVPLPGSGAFALVVPDALPIAPPAPVIGNFLQSGATLPLVATNLVAGGKVTPLVSPASRIPELVTATAEVIVTNRGGNLSSGTLLRGEVTETYQLNDGSRRFPAGFDQFIVGYQRPGDTRLDTVRAEFPLRPLLLFGTEELKEALVHLDLFPPGAFNGGVLDPGGGLVASDGVRVLAGPGDLLEQQAVTLRRLNPTNFSDLAGTNLPVLAAFELGINRVAPDRRLVVQFNGLPTNSTFVLARVLARDGLYGAEPRERLRSDASGNLLSDEPATGDRLPGLTGAGQYVLMQVVPPQGLVTGIARNSSNAPAADLPVRIVSQPWLTFSAEDGGFKLLAPLGDAIVLVNDLGTGDSGQQTVNLTNLLVSVTANVGAAPSGPRVAKVTPANNATSVQRVTSVVVEFDRPLNPATVVGSGLALLDTNGAPVPASLSLNLRGTVATLLPANPLAPSARHTVLLSTNLADPAGRKLEGPSQFSFTTESDALNRAGFGLVIYEPINGLARMTGSPGMAEPESPVILDNETSGATATVLSKADGSFDNFIGADPDDRLLAVIVNRNGTRNTFRPTRQIFRDGSVGLFDGGGLVGLESPLGDASLNIQAGAIQGRTRVKLEMVDSNELAQLTTNTPPAEGKLLGRAMRVLGSGSAVTGAADVSFSVSRAELEQLGLPPGANPADATYGLVAITKVDGHVTYFLLNKLEYENGNLVTHSPPFPGAEFLMEPNSGALRGFVEGVEIISKGLSAFLGPFDFMMAPLILAFQSQPLVFTGAAVEFSSVNGQRVATPLPGTVVTLSQNTGALNDSGRRGRLNPGQLYTVAQRRGIYALLQPRPFVDPFNAEPAFNFVLSATHPRLFGQAVYKAASRPTLNLSITDLIFHATARSVFANEPPGASVSHTPAFPPIGSNAQLTVTMTHATAMPALEELAVESVVPVTPEVQASASDVQLGDVITEDVTAQVRRARFTVSSGRKADVTLKIKVSVPGVPAAIVRYTIPFGQSPPTGDNPALADKADKSSPRVLFSEPPQYSTGVDWAKPIRLVFSEPLDRNTVTSNCLSLSPSAGKPLLKLSSDQRELLVSFPDMVAGQDYVLRFGENVTDLPPASNKFDQDSTTDGFDVFLLNFRSAPKILANFPGVTTGGGVVVRGSYAYVLDREGGGGDGFLRVFDITDPANPTQAAEHFIPGTPRDLILIPSYSFKRRPDSPVETKDLLAVSFGNIGASFDGQNFIGGGQFIRIFDISQPTVPVRLLTRQVTLSFTTVIPRLRWSPPMLAYLENGADLQSFGVINLQTLILSEFMTDEEFFAGTGSAGNDANGDGDFVDAGEELPSPDPRSPDFAGKVFSFAVTDTTQRVRDFNYVASRGYFGAVLGEGKLNDIVGQSTTTNVAPCYRSFFAGNLTLSRELASFSFTNGDPKRLFNLFGVVLSVSNASPRTFDLAFVSVNGTAGNSVLEVLDITDPTDPRRLTSLPVAVADGFVQSVQQRSDGMLLLATTENVMVINPNRLGEAFATGGQHPAVVTRLPSVGSGAFSFGSEEYGVIAESLGSKSRLLQTPPLIEFVAFPQVSPFDPHTIVGQDIVVQGRLENRVTVQEMGPSRFKAIPGVVDSTLNPPSPNVHYYVLIRAPGGDEAANREIDVLLESLNDHAHPLRNKGAGFPPVRAAASGTVAAIQQDSRGECDSPIRPLKAVRLSNDKRSPYYNYYLSIPFALTYESIKKADLQVLQDALNREILWSGHFLRATLDTTVSALNAIGSFAASVDTSRLLVKPGVSVLAACFPADYLMGPNPPPVTGPAVVPGTFGTVSAHNGEVRMDTTDIALPSRRMPVVFRRHVGAQDLFDGPFGRGWDFNYNQRLIEMKGSFFDANAGVPLVIRGGVGDEIGRRSDLVFNSGDGRTLLYRFAGTKTNPPPEIAADPLVGADQLNWINSAVAYYLPPEGIFDFFVRFADGRFARLEADGTQYWYGSGGRLERIYDRYTANVHELSYNQKGELIRITDKSVASPRFLEIGYWRPPEEVLDPTLDKSAIPSQAYKIGKICRLKDYAGRDLLFDYTPCGELALREGINVTTAFAGGATGRARTEYVPSLSPVEQANGIRGVVAGSAEGAKLFMAQGFAGNPDAPVVSSGEGAVGAVGISLQHGNTAAAVSAGNARTQITGADSAGTEMSFDRSGLPKEFKFTGAGAPPASVKYEYTNGLLSVLTQPEGNSVSYTYDFLNPILRSRGNLVKMKREKGPRPGDAMPESTFAYEPKYNLPSGANVDFNGNHIVHSLNAVGKDVGRIEYSPGTGISPVSGNEEFFYNAFGQLERHKTIEGFDTTFEYDPTSGFKTSEIVLDAGITRFTYLAHASHDGDLGLPTSIQLPVGAPVDLTYNEREELVLSERDSKQREERSYDLNGRLVRRATRLDDAAQILVETRGYLQNGFLSRVSLLAVETEGAGRDLTTEFVPDLMFRVAEIRHPEPGVGLPRTVTKFEDFDHLGRHHKVTEGQYSETYAYDGNGNLLTVTRDDAEDHFEYDGYDRLRFVRKAGQSGTEVVEHTYFPGDDLASTSLTDGQQNLISKVAYQIDSLGRTRLVEASSDSGISRTSYDYDGLVVTTTDPENEVTTATYDRAGRVKQVRDSVRIRDFVYDANDNPVSVKSTEAGVEFNTFFEDYNSLEQLRQIRDDVGIVLKLAPRVDGSILSSTDARNGTTDFNPTKLGEASTRNKPNGVEFRYRFDEHRRVSSISDRTGAGHGFEYDDTLREVRRTFRSGSPGVVTSFDPRHRQPLERNIPGGSETLGYDPQGRLTSRVVNFGAASRRETFTHDPQNRLVQADYPGGSVSLKFDKLGPVRQTTFTHQGKSYQLSTSIRKDGVRETLTYPAPAPVQISEERDSAGRLQVLSLESGDRIVSGRVFVAADLVGSEVLGGNVLRCDSKFDGRKRLTERSYTSIATGKVLAEIRYRYDATDNIVARQFPHRAGRTDFFHYDSGHRLVRADLGVRPQISPAGLRPGYTGFQIPAEVAGAWSPGIFSRTYGYDFGGGLDLFTGMSEIDPDLLAPVDFARSYGPAGGFLQMTQIDGLVRPADSLGNSLRNRLFTRPAGAQLPIPTNATLSYDGLKQLLSVSRDDGVLLTYQYQHDGLLFHREISQPGNATVSTGLVYDGPLLIAEYDQAGTSSDLRARYYYADTDVPVAADIRDQGGSLRRYFFMTDALGSVMGLVDTNGAVVERYFYDAWGQPEIQTPDTRAPRIRRVLTASDGNGLIVEFTERVLPKLLTNLTQNLRVSYQELAESFTVTNGTSALIPAVIYEESLANFGFGTAVRVVVGGTLTGAVTLVLQPDRFTDEWGNPNLALTNVFLFNATPGTVLFSDDVTPSTASLISARSLVGNPFLFHGQYLDYDAGLYYLRARFYDPGSGLFLQQDPNGYEDSVNLYAAFSQNPISMRDPSGRAPNPLGMLDDAAKAIEMTIQKQASRNAQRAIQKGVSKLTLEEEEAIQKALIQDGKLAAKEVRPSSARPPANAPTAQVRPPRPAETHLPVNPTPHAPPPTRKLGGKVDAAGEAGAPGVKAHVDEAAPTASRTTPDSATLPGGAATPAPAIRPAMTPAPNIRPAMTTHVPAQKPVQPTSPAPRPTPPPATDTPPARPFARPTVEERLRQTPRAQNPGSKAKPVDDEPDMFKGERGTQGPNFNEQRISDKQKFKKE